MSPPPPVGAAPRPDCGGLAHLLSGHSEAPSVRTAGLFILARRKVPSLSASAIPKHPKRGTCFPDGERCPHFRWRTPCSLT